LPRVIFVLIVAAIVGLAVLIVPAMKKSLFGNSFQIRINVLAAEEDRNVDFKGETIAQTVVEMEMLFPMGAAPDNCDDFNVKDDNGPVTVYWQSNKLEKEDIPERGLTRWHFREVFFPIGFRQGWVRQKDRELVYLKLPTLPFNPSH
jgi:hypothetical protein